MLTIVEEETKLRRRLEESEGRGRSHLCHFADQNLKAAEVQMCALQGRRAIERDEARSRFDLGRYLQVNTAATVVMFTEKESREVIQSQCFRELLHLRDVHIAALRCEGIRQAEMESRTILTCDEELRRGQFRRAHEQYVSTHNSQCRDRHLLVDACTAGRTVLVEEERSLRAEFLEQWAEGCLVIDSWYAARLRLNVEYDKSLQQLSVHQEQHRHEIRRSFNEAQEILEKAFRQLLGLLESLERAERRARAALEESDLSDRQDLQMQMVSERQDVEEYEEAVRKRREQDIHECYRVVARIAEEEGTAFAELLQSERLEYHQREVWIQSKLDARTMLTALAEDTVEQLLRSIITEFSSVRQQFNEQTVQVLEWVETKAADRQAFEVQALAEHTTAVPEEEFQARLALQRMMQIREDQVRLWMKEKQGKRSFTELDESEKRRALLEYEDNVRTHHYTTMCSGLELLQDLAQERAQQRQRLVKQYDESCAQLLTLEASLWRELTQWFVQEQQPVLASAHFRERLEFELLETVQRDGVSFPEVQSRERLRLTMILERQAFERQAQELLQHRLNELSVEEDTNRTLILHDHDETWQLLLYDAKHDQEIAQDNERLRLESDFVVIAERMREFPRLYDDTEVPIETGRLSYAMYRKSTGGGRGGLDEVDSPTRPSFVMDEEHNDPSIQRRQYLAQALRGPMFQLRTVPDETVEKLVAVVDWINARNMTLAAEIATLNRANDVEHAVMAKQQATIEDARAKRKEWTLRFERMKESHHNSRLTEKDRRAKIVQEIANKEAKEKALLQQLQALKNTIAAEKERKTAHYRAK